MEILQIPQADLLDILFDGRNKNYGAYDLRKTYNNRLKKSLALTVSLCLLLIGAYTLAGKLAGSPSKFILASPDIILSEPPVLEKTVEIPKAMPKPPSKPPEVATLKDFVPQITVDKDVKPEDVPHTQDDLDHTRLGALDKTGTFEDGPVASSPGNGEKNGILKAPLQKEMEDNGIFRSVEIESAYIGGISAWKKFIDRTFRYPQQAEANQITGTVIVEFVVDKEGKVSNVQAINGPEELRQEAIRVIQKSGRWVPAIQNGRNVNSFKRQPITFAIAE